MLNIARNAADAIGRDGAMSMTLRNGALTSEGRGLGLTIVQEILTNHGFGYSLQNGVGGGAEFVVRF